MLQNLRLSLYQQHLTEQLRKHHVDHKILSFQQAKHIGILFDGTDESHIPTINQYVELLEKGGKNVSLLCFIDAVRAMESLAFPTFSRKETNWYFQPTSHEALTFVDKKFDVLINAFLQESLVLEYISTFSKAQFRVGPYLKDKQHCFDFMINIGQGSLDDFMKNTLHYLKMFDSSLAST